MRLLKVCYNALLDIVSAVAKFVSLFFFLPLICKTKWK